jgi:mannose PTS system EIIA component
MVGLVIATHGHLAEELLHTAEQIVGQIPQAAPCHIEPGASPEQIREQVKRAVASVEVGDGVIVLADLFGGTPCTQSLILCRQCRLEVVTGVNLPMLIKANALRQEALELPQMAIALALYGQKNITCPTAVLRESVAAPS